MNEYNDIWTREKFIEYRKLKRSGYSDQQLKEHFGDDIWYSGIYNKNSNILPWHLFTEIKVNPIETPYSFWERNSYFYLNKLDYNAEFIFDSEKYILSLMYYEINNIPTYNVTFSTKEQYDEHIIKLEFFLKKGFITNNELEELQLIFEKETDLNVLHGVIKRLSFIIFDLYYKKINGCMLSLGETKRKIKLDYYRNIIRNSFKNVTESIQVDNYGNKYYLYDIK